MYLFKDSNNNYYTYIHIPKNSGKYIRKKIDEKYNRVLYMWGRTSQNIDNAHLAYLDVLKKIQSCKEMQHTRDIKISFFTFVRNPYDRAISAYYYLKYNQRMKFGEFLKNIINMYLKNRFIKYCVADLNNINYEQSFIHLYPQYLFLLDENKNVSPNIKIEKLENCNSRYSFLNFHDFKIKKYDYNDYFTCKEHYEIINDFYTKDFEYFGYEKIILPYENETNNTEIK